MNQKLAATMAASLSAGTLAALPASADVSVPRIISDGMVVQQKVPIRLFGRATPGEKVTLKLGSQSGTATTGSNGQWDATLKALPSGGPYTLTISGKNTLTIKDVLVGEVWVCSGQSNMEWTTANTTGGAEAALASADPKLRMFTVTKTVQGEPQYDVAGGTWESAAPQTTPRFSAVGYYFARALRKKLGVPIGMIHTSWGGTRIETWMSKETLLSVGLKPTEWDVYKTTPEAAKQRLDAYEKQVAAWKAAGSPRGVAADTGVSAAAKGWSNLDLTETDWQRIALPGAWEQSGIASLQYLDGVVWFRKEVTLPSEWSGKSATLTLGAIDDHDTTFINGVKVGATGAETSNSWEAPRSYTVPAGVLKSGRNVIAVRVWDQTGGGGLTGPTDAMKLTPGQGGSPISLAGDWQFKIERSIVSDPGAPPSVFDPQTVSGLYNGMLAPLTKYAIKGALWYQGESNAFKTSGYEVRMPAMIQNWRKDWGIKDMPFFMVQLAPYSAGNPEGDNWPYLRETQRRTTEVLPNVGMAVITDVGELNDIHPRNKQPVGERLALLARQVAYGEQGLNATGPVFKSVRFEKGKAYVTFANTGGGLVARGIPGRQYIATPTPEGFTIAGTDGKFIGASAKIVSQDTVEVSAPEVTDPKMVRFGWKNFPVVDLWSKAGLPTSPFRTDSLPF
ncbi:MAG: sialate O-acetylesterase [Armatimonadota bacterium]